MRSGIDQVACSGIVVRAEGAIKPARAAAIRFRGPSASRTFPPLQYHVGFWRSGRDVLNPGDDRTNFLEEEIGEDSDPFALREFGGKWFPSRRKGRWPCRVPIG